MKLEVVKSSVAWILCACIIWTGGDTEFDSSTEPETDAETRLSVTIPNQHIRLNDAEIVEKQIELDKLIFQQEADAEKEDGLLWTFSSTLNHIITEYPLVPLVYFQQTLEEVRLKRPGRKTINGISKFFIIRANETYIDLQEIREAALTRQTLTRSPWALVRFMIRLQMIHAHAQEHQRDSEKNQSEQEKRDQKHRDLIRYVSYTTNQDRALSKLAGDHNTK
ncbi:unnamed protein product [Allacma fusca]|uniref:Uncharacterized protein n=1 Tax=Allacma fusca TaxID=39272 RepID=A0A8J2JQK2_9HEXA|nr:unnamed protein product [Allacma fusca]